MTTSETVAARRPVSDLEHVALSRLVVETLWRVDHGVGNTCYELFTEDGEIWMEGELFFKGRDAIRGWGDNRMDPETIRHFALNLRFESDGQDRAVGTGSELVYFAPEKQFGPEAMVPLMIGEWRFECVRAEDGWLFARIDCHVMFDRREGRLGFDPVTGNTLVA